MRIAEVLVYSNVYVSLGMASLAAAFMAYAGMQLVSGIIISVFLVTFALYSLDRTSCIDEDMKNDSPRTRFIRTHRRDMEMLSLVSFILAMYIAYQASAYASIVLVIPLVVGVLYGKKTRILHNRRLKSVPVLKNIIVAANWAIITVAFPLVYLGVGVGAMTAFLALFIFMRIFIGSVFFDMRDVRGDKKERTMTLPVIFGNTAATKMLYVLNAVCLVMLLYATVNISMSLAYLIVPVAFGFLGLRLLGRMKMQRLCDFIVDGEYLLTGIVVLAIHFSGIA